MAMSTASNFRQRREQLPQTVPVAMDSPPQLTSLPASLEDVRIKTLPSSAFYIADFITKEEEQVLLNKVSHIRFCLDIADLSRSKQHLNHDGNNYPKDAFKYGPPI